MQPISNADFIVPVEIDGTVHQVMWSVSVRTPENVKNDPVVIDCNAVSCRVPEGALTWY